MTQISSAETVVAASMTDATVSFPALAVGLDAGLDQGGMTSRRRLGLPVVGELAGARGLVDQSGERPPSGRVAATMWTMVPVP